MSKKLYLETYGCQMNVHDSEKASYSLSTVGYELTDSPAEADLILLNTCMVREKAARKVYSRISDLKNDLRSLPRTKETKQVFGVMGCVAQAEADRMFERSKDIQLILGTQAIGKLPELISQLDSGFPRAIDVRLTKAADFFEVGADVRQTEHIAYITIIEGCNKFCSFCIVPFTRGRERSRSADRIVAEAQALAAQGYQEVHLLGQNVNSYGLTGRYHGNEIPDSEKSNDITFSSLLKRVASESNIPRIKFTTSYPRDFDQSVVQAIDEHENLCEWIHLPVQSGSNRILRAMRRGYTREEYLEKIAFIKNAKKDISITGDMIVGFPGETEEDFNETLSLAAEVEYDGLYIFNYSPRPHTPAAAYADSVPENVKAERFAKLQELQKRIQARRYGRYVGGIVEVLVEGESARSALDYYGHTRCNKVVNFPKVDGSVEKIVKVKVTDAKPNSLYGHLI
ncbi:MAG TPA: tRNA (N6-isopentenyl adenosine(37)-C2)-methylthiotransferase MiaB [Blastocatellia bacterium]|nr:tRNA (N6-isopentenyl adenosine(37)-C2)-methylthiotransferase MiaB [Blastocatellia bacterium]HMX25891.1 tRNA (N6-isopentenyl adenosine(37)-C2)-methylthiotransferase MiaB [Blastocatellia bacterium]HMZ19005.1 tRNA (N6-isopentenyl adenosine(37)-C2)-methylthiotransferase MiaB [Blastocatellia bacterium]HNG28307.1 tRNA (N6-isopentenyl adenosine(37)-C2)-methylthiotransferase MiaB [Blastocatellia bacterium]